MNYYIMDYCDNLPKATLSISKVTKISTVFQVTINLENFISL